MRKIVLGMVVAAVAIPTAASAQPGYYDPSYGRGGYSHPYDRNGDGVVSAREARHAQVNAQRYNNQYRNNYGNGYGQNYGNGYDRNYGNGYSQGGYYPQAYGGANRNYYGQNGYYSGPTWRGNNGSYHCRRSDGSTGTVVGAGVGALIGSQIAGRGDRTLGAVLGGAVGALIGSSADRGNRNGRDCR